MYKRQTEGVGLRERKKLRTQLELKRVALELFSERGFDHVTTDDIAAAAEVSKTTFYRYFDSKEDVLLGNAAEKLDQMREALADRPDTEPPLTAVRNAMLTLAGRYEIDREQKVLLGRLVRETPSLAARNLEQQVATQNVLATFLAERLGEPADSLRSVVLAANVLATLRVAIDHWVASGGKKKLPDVVSDALQLLADGVPDTTEPPKPTRRTLRRAEPRKPR